METEEKQREANKVSSSSGYPFNYRISLWDGGSMSGLPVVQFSPITREELMYHWQAILEAQKGGNDKQTVAPIEPRLGMSVQARQRASRRKGIRLAYRMANSAVPLVQAILRSHGFWPTKKEKWTLLWTGSHLKSYVFQGLNPFQRVNQFPRSYEVTRKDSLTRNIGRMQQLHGAKHFSFMPRSFVLPSELATFERDAKSWKGSWIVKPAASSQGRGIYITADPVAERAWEGYDGGITISEYIDNPLLVDGHKFDMRIYVGVTSMNPLRVYVHEEGLCRFATEPFDPDPKHLHNRFMHLTNYSINKHSDKFVKEKTDGVRVEAEKWVVGGASCGYKWPLPALWKRLEEAGVDVNQVKQSIDDLVVKTILSIEGQVNAATTMFVPYDTNCFELFGFDVLLDEALNPWLIEVNFAPSLACDAAVDLSAKSKVIADLFSLVGVPVCDQRDLSTKASGGRKAATPQTQHGKVNKHNVIVETPQQVLNVAVDRPTRVLEVKENGEWRKVQDSFAEEAAQRGTPLPAAKTLVPSNIIRSKSAPKSKTKHATGSGVASDHSLRGSPYKLNPMPFIHRKAAKGNSSDFKPVSLKSKKARARQPKTRESQQRATATPASSSMGPSRKERTPAMVHDPPGSARTPPFTFHKVEGERGSPRTPGLSTGERKEREEGLNPGSCISNSGSDTYSDSFDEYSQDSFEDSSFEEDNTQSGNAGSRDRSRVSSNPPEAPPQGSASDSEEVAGAQDPSRSFSNTANDLHDGSIVQSLFEDLDFDGQERRLVKRTQAEWSRRGGFRRVYPTRHGAKYTPFFERSRPDNLCCIAYLLRLSKLQEEQAMGGGGGGSSLTTTAPDGAIRPTSRSQYRFRQVGIAGDSDTLALERAFNRRKKAARP